MSELNFNPVFQETSSLFRDEPFSAIHFGRHCGKNLLILKHDLTFLLVFGDDLKWSRPEFVKPVCFRGNPVKGGKIVGNKDVVFMLDDDGNLWRLINAFEVSHEKNECLHSLEEKCFYEWVPFKKFNFAKALAICVFGSGFACLGISWNSERKLVVLPTIDSGLQDYTFEGLSANNSFSYYLTNLHINPKKSPTSEVLLVGDRFTGKLYLCSKPRTKSLVHKSDIYLVSVLNFQNESCLVVCLESGKLIFRFYNENETHFVYLSKKIVCIEKCCCTGSCLLWSDGVKLQHTKLSFKCGDDVPVKVSHLKLNFPLACPLSLLKIDQSVLTVSVNGIYYCITPGMGEGEEVRKELSEVLTEIYKGSGTIQQLQHKIDSLTYYLQCKEMIQKKEAKVEISLEGKRLLLRGCSGNFLRDFWKVKLTTSAPGRNLVEMIDLESDLKEGILIGIETPFKRQSKMTLSLVGDFNGNYLFVNLGEVSTNETELGMVDLRKQLKEIMVKRNPYVKESYKDGEFTSELY